RTKLLGEVSLHQQHTGNVQAAMRGCMHRSQFSADIVAQALAASPFKANPQELAQLAHAQKPAVSVGQELLQKQASQLALAKRESRPDFNLGYQYQRTGDQFRDYYMLTLGIQLPRRRRQHEEVAEAAAMQDKSKQELDAE